ncbi:MAG: HipA domain-containing protein [Actinobacteria bacterium]|nr:HipA domain-containing protein [Actinomycetota bacterium]
MVSTPAALDLFLYGVRVAIVTRAASPRVMGRLHWEWTGDAVRRWGIGSRVVSHSLPIGTSDKGLDVRATAFVDGLLPEGDLRTRRAIDLGVDPEDSYALLHRCGVDTAGALVAVPAGTAPREAPTAYGDVLDDPDLAQLLHDAGRGQLRDVLTSISLAGLVPKIGVVRDDTGAWRLPSPGQPSTWIVKLAHPRESSAADVVDTEALCLDLGRRCGVTGVDAEILELGSTRAIALRRYDRLADGSRLHQEDLAQALSLATRDPERKFQRGRTLPSWAHAAGVLREGGGLLSPLARLLTFSFLVGNTDHHAKNIGFLRYVDGTVRLASAYDVAAHLHHPGPHWFALDVAGRRDAAEVTIGDVLAEVTAWGIDAVRARAAVVDVIVALQSALTQVDRRAHPGVPPEAWGLLTDRVDEAAAFLDGRRP